jgi:polyferredoxin
MRENEHWDDSKQIAKGILHDRSARRRWLGFFLIASLGMIAVGMGLLDAWLASGPLFFLLWWGTCAVLTLFTLLFGLYDALLVIREEKAKGRG